MATTDTVKHDIGVVSGPHYGLGIGIAIIARRVRSMRTAENPCTWQQDV